MTTSGESPRGLVVTVDLRGSEVLLGLDGELHADRAPELAAVLDALFEGGHDSVLLELADLGGLAADAAGVARRFHALQGVLGGWSTIGDPPRIVDIDGTSARFRLLLDGANRQRVRAGSPTSAARTGPDVLRDTSRADQLSLVPIARAVLDESLRLIVNLAKVSVGGADGASVSLWRDGEIRTVAASDETILEMDAGQYATGEGPCLAASAEGRLFHIESLQNETRWPAFVPVAQALGIQAILSNPLMDRSRPVGALNIYSRAPQAFGSTQRELASAFAREASDVLSRAVVDVAAGRLQAALRSREIIAQAQGVLMERAGVDEVGAFDHLRRSAQQSDRPLREGAESVVASTRGRERDDGRDLEGSRE